MGGVDLADMLISLYRTPWKSKRWYLRVLVHCLDIAKVNAWLLYRRYADQLKIPKRRQMRLCKFSSKIAHSLLQRDKPVDRPLGRPLKRKSVEVRIERRGKWAPAPQADVQFDEIGHWPEKVSSKGKCRHCKMTCRYICKKCSRSVASGNIHLCLEENRNCFYDFHTPQ